MSSAKRRRVPKTERYKRMADDMWEKVMEELKRLCEESGKIKTMKPKAKTVLEMKIPDLGEETKELDQLQGSS